MEQRGNIQLSTHGTASFAGLTALAATKRPPNRDAMSEAGVLSACVVCVCMRRTRFDAMVPDGKGADDVQCAKRIDASCRALSESKYEAAASSSSCDDTSRTGMNEAVQKGERWYCKPAEHTKRDIRRSK